MEVDGRRRLQAVRRSLIGAILLLLWDGALSGSFLASYLTCPVWFLFSLLKNAIQRPGWGLGLIRIGIPAVTLGLAMANDAVQLRVGEANARRVVAACEAYHAATGEFPRKLDELVPRYLDSVPLAKYCLGPPSQFFYTYNSGSPIFFWQVVPPYYRGIYNFETRSWSYRD